MNSRRFMLVPRRREHRNCSNRDIGRPRQCLLWVNRAILTVRRLLPVFPHKQTFQGPPACLKGAINGHGRLFDHLIGAGKQRGRHGEVERFGGLEIDCQLEFRGYFDWQLTWLFAAQYSIDIECGTAEQVDI